MSWAPRGVHRKMREIDRARTSVERREGRSATLSDVAGEMGLPPDEVSTLLVEAQRALMCPIEDLNEEQVSNSPLQLDSDPFVHLERKELLELIGAAIEELPERQKLLLWLYYYEQLTMKEAGLVLGVNEARTSQIHSKAISTLRESVKRRLAVDDAGTSDGQDIRLLRRPPRRVQKQSRPQAKDGLSETHGI
jgi:RNA polymerase sigma factor FliA